MSGQPHATAIADPVKQLGRPQSWSGHFEEKNLCPFLESDPTSSSP